MCPRFDSWWYHIENCKNRFNQNCKRFFNFYWSPYHLKLPIISSKISTINEHLRHLCSESSSFFILTDANVSTNWLATLLHASELLQRAELIELDPGEENKSIAVCDQIWQLLLDNHCDRHALILNFGGGVITDVGGFIASTYKRGIRYINMPTTLMSMVDAAVGGKTAINVGGVKNAIGTFHQPLATFIVPEFLSSLPNSELCSGFAEMLKCGIVADVQLWNNLKNQHVISCYECLEDQILPCAELKQRIVMNDLHDMGQRQLLNFGHTIGHALEAYWMTQNNVVTHGYCVAAGMVCEVRIAQSKGICSATVSKEIEQVIRLHFDFSNNQFPRFAEIEKFILNDKKNRDGQISFVFPESIGRAQWGVRIDTTEVERLYDDFRKSILSR
ncbi:MAG: 3-dehydroquinate synthase [Flavobacteriales bacterium]